MNVNGVGSAAFQFPQLPDQAVIAAVVAARPAAAQMQQTAAAQTSVPTPDAEGHFDFYA